MGHEVALAPNHGLTGGMIQAGEMRVYPNYRGKVCEDVLAAHAKHFGADLVITLYDAWPYPVDFAAGLHLPWMPWFPQDSYPPCSTVVERVKTADYPIAMSRFGLESMREQGVECHYIPHACAVDVYKPLDKAKCREDIRLPQDKFIVLMVAANQSFPSRKAFPEALSAFKLFHDEHPDALLYLHTTPMPRGQAWDGVEMHQLIRSLGIQDCTVFTEEYSLILGLPDSEMAKIYNAADVLLSPSMGEGFGIPIIEAQSCGLPVITNKFSSMTELTFNGIAAEPLQASWTALNTWMAVPSIQGIKDALESIYARTEADKAQFSQLGRQAIIKDYSWPVIIEAWRVLLEQVEHGERPSQERLYHHVIRGIPVDVYDDKLSFTTGCVAAEIEADAYGLEKIDFQPGDVILDIGGHVGTFAIYCAKRWPGIRVITLEPSPTNYGRLLSGCERTGQWFAIGEFAQGIVLNNNSEIVMVHCGVTADARQINLALARGNTGGTTEFCKPNGHLIEPARTITLDSIMAHPAIGIDRIKLLKIDAEGAEHEILTTATCLDKIDFISGEFHINSTLEAKGYSIAGLYQHLKQHIPASKITYTSCAMGE